MTTASRSDAREAMIGYRSRGWNPLPSRDDKKAPRVAFGDYWQTVGPDWWLDKPTTNVQVMTGTAWRLMVLDLDGPMAIEVFRSWSMFRDLPPTWESAHSPAIGRHLWYGLPADLEACPSRFIWELAGAKHAAVEILGDSKLAIAPPSRHIATGRPYRWLPDRSPATIAAPAMAPDWLLALPDIRRKPEVVKPRISPAPGKPRRFGLERYARSETLDAIADKRALVESWGLRVVGNAKSRGWAKCHAFDREDRHPSSGFNEATGRYRDFVQNEAFGLFDLAVEMGVYPDFPTACDELGRRYGVRPMEVTR